MRVINSVAQFVRVENSVLKTQILDRCRSFVNDIEIKRTTNTFNDEEVVSDIRRYVLIHLQNLNHCLADIERARSIVANAKS